VLIANGWSVEDVFEVLQLNQEKTVVVERIVRDRPFQFPSRPYWSLEAIGQPRPTPRLPLPEDIQIVCGKMAQGIQRGKNWEKSL
jgi:hypothetical protein